jgi:hypothetical protein
MTFDRSGTTDRMRWLLDLTHGALQELNRMTTRPGCRPFFRVWDYHPHKTYRSWLIQVPDDDEVLQIAPLVLERTWDAAQDRERLARDLRRRPRVQPTLCVREARLPAEEFAPLREVGKRIPFPLLELRDTHALQSAQYGIEGVRRDAVRLRSAQVRLEWNDPLPGLKAVARWAAQVRALCESAFPDADISIVRTGPTGTCSLCRRAALEETTSCPDCKVVYHRECWDYVGRCAIYGCGGGAGGA